jgi:hypothetical protein
MISKKNNGFRKITIQNEIYNWKLVEVIQIRPNGNQSNKLEINIGYFDVWLYIKDEENKPEDYEPKIVTPSFIKKSIENAIKLGWDIKDKNKLTRLKYSNGIFEIE